MACPFSRISGPSRVDGAGDDQPVGSDDIARRINERFKPSRQSSVQITSSLLGEEIDEQEDTQTLNLKHLRAAVLVLTNPSVLYMTHLTSNG